MEVTTGKTYVVSGAACTITDDATGKVICTHAGEGAQSVFVAISPSVTASSEDVKITSPFKGASTAGLGGGGSLTPDQLTAVENAVGGMLEDVATKAHEAIKATGWISSAVWDEMQVGAELFEINGTPFYNHGSASTADLATAINEILGGLVTASAPSESMIALEAHTAGAQGNTITLSTTNPNVYLSGDSLTGGEDEVKDSMRLIVDNEGLHFANIPEGAVLNTGGLPIDTIGGNVYHRNGSATFSGTEGGHTYNAVIDFKHFEVRKNGQLIVHFHESNNKPVLEMGGSPVLTADFMASTEVAANIDYANMQSLGKELLEQLAPTQVVGNSMFYNSTANISNLGNVAQTFKWNVFSESEPDHNGCFIGRPDLGVTSIRMITSYWGMRLCLNDAACDFDITYLGATQNGFLSQFSTHAVFRAKTLRLYFPKLTNGATVLNFNLYPAGIPNPVSVGAIHLIAPLWNNVQQAAGYNKSFVARREYVSEIECYAFLPSQNVSFEFFKDVRVPSKCIAHLLNNLGTPSTVQPLTVGIRAEEGHYEDDVWQPDDAELLAAMAAHPMWTLSFNPYTL